MGMAMRNLKDVRGSRQRRNKIYWAKVARDIERWARAIVLPGYAIALACLFQVDFEDGYGIDGAQTSMFQGTGIPVWRATAARGIGIIMIPVLLTVTLLVLVFVSAHLDAALASKKDKSEKEAVRNMLNAVGSGSTSQLESQSAREVSDWQLTDAQKRPPTKPGGVAASSPLVSPRGVAASSPLATPRGRVFSRH